MCFPDFRMSLETTVLPQGVEETTLITPGEDMENSALTIEEKFGILETNINAFFVIVMGIIVFLMQAGFAFLEAGSVR